MFQVARAGLLALAAAALAAGARADDSHSSSSSSSAATDDTDLIEFLGTLGAEDDEWLNYLGRTDPTKVARAPQSSSASSGSKQNE